MALFPITPHNMSLLTWLSFPRLYHSTSPIRTISLWVVSIVCAVFQVMFLAPFPTVSLKRFASPPSASPFKYHFVASPCLTQDPHSDLSQPRLAHNRPSVTHFTNPSLTDIAFCRWDPYNGLRAPLSHCTRYIHSMVSGFWCKPVPWGKESASLGGGR